MDKKEKKFLKECLELLDYFHKDYSGGTIYLTSGDTSCIMNPKSKFYKTFGGYSINNVAIYVAKSLNKKTKYVRDE